MTTTQATYEQRPYWFVGASFGGTDDQTDRFLREGIWENGYQLEGDGRYFDQVNAMRPGDRIAIKSTYVRKSGVPFDNDGRDVSTMAIKAVGTITRNIEDGCRVEVDWTPVNPNREWYFYTYRPTIWQVSPGQGTIPWAADELIRFAFENKPQDYQRFLERWDWLDGELGDATTPNLWDNFVERAKEYVNSGRLEKEEIEYKVEISQALAVAREAVLAGTNNWASLLKSGIIKNQNNLIHFTQLDNFRNWVGKSPDDALNALRGIWAENDSSVSERILAFSEKFPRSVTGGSGTRMNVISVLLMGVDAEQYPPFRVRFFEESYKRTEYPQPERDTDEAALYEHALGFLDRFIEETAQRGLTLRHRLDAQSVAWAIQDKTPPTPEIDDDEDDIEPSTPPDLQALADEVFLPVEFLEEIHTLLKEKKQIIFQGPPGTGKTFVAQKLAACLAESEEWVTLVQFHPSYAYEDFIQGFRPKTTDGQAGFELRNGPLLQAAERAREEPDANHYLVIDEINRGNVAKVFGELYFLLEYRDSEMNLQYSDEPFSLPPNLYIIGTMNTADRSIALVDMALRRRFYFKMFHPDDEPVKSVLRKWIAQNATGMEWVADVVERTNELLKADRHAAIGPSYFMTPGLNEAAVRRIWEHSVLPYLEERRFGGDEVAEEFDLDKLRRTGGPASTQEDGEVPEESAAGDKADGVSNASA